MRWAPMPGLHRELGECGECHSLGAYPRIGDAPEYPETFRESFIDAVGP